MQRGCSGTAQILDALVDGMSENQFEKVLVVDLLPNRLSECFLFSTPKVVGISAGNGSD